VGNLKDVYIMDLPSVEDERGILTVVEKDLPIEIKRIFYMHNIIKDRGGHAHMYTYQIIIPIAGSFKMKLSDEEGSREIEMNDARKGVYVPRLVFVDFSAFSTGSVCLVLSSTIYDFSKSLRSWDDYINYIKG